MPYCAGRALCCNVDEMQHNSNILVLRAKQVAFICAQVLIYHSSRLIEELHDQQDGPSSSSAVASTAISTIEVLTGALSFSGHMCMICSITITQVL